MSKGRGKPVSTPDKDYVLNLARRVVACVRIPRTKHDDYIGAAVLGILESFAVDRQGRQPSEVRLYYSGRRAVINQLRSEALQGAPISFDPAATESDGTGQIEAKDHISRHWDKLNEAERDVVYLRFWLDLSIREIGRTYEVPRSTAHRRLQTALAKLRNEQGEQAHDSRSTHRIDKGAQDRSSLAA